MFNNYVINIKNVISFFQIILNLKINLSFKFLQILL